MHDFRNTLNPRPLARHAAAVLLVGALGLPVHAAEAPSDPVTAHEQLNYSVGYRLGQYLAKLQRQGTGIALQPVFQGMLDALSGGEARLSDAEMRAALATLEASSEAKDRSAPPPPARTGGYVDDFAALNARREGVVSLPSGVQYEVLKAGSGRHPGAHDVIEVRYEGSLSDGVVFDSTDETEKGKPLRMELDQIVVPGLREALSLMREGDQWRVVIPPSMGFARAGNNLLRRRDLIYTIELLAVFPPAP